MSTENAKSDPLGVAVEAVNQSYDEGFNAGHQQGYEEGFKRGLTAVLDWLQYSYIDDPGRPDRNAPEGRAILELAQKSKEYAAKVLTGEITLSHTGLKS
jgi:hypothetical protein